jgi:hypothetical protein
MPRFINASVQTPNKLLRMVAEEICGQNSRKPADRYMLNSVGGSGSVCNLGLLHPNPDPVVQGVDPALAPSIIKQK